MTITTETITPAPGNVVAPALVGSVTETGAGHSSASTTDRARRNLTDCQKGIIGPHEYERVRVSPIVRKVEASRAARTHVLEAIHFARKGHVLSSFRCCCGARGRTCDPNRERGHAKLYSLFEQHKNGPDVRGTGPRGEHGRLVAEADMV